MPSQNTNNLPGANKARSANNIDNTGRGEVRAGGTNTGFNSIPIARNLSTSTSAETVNDFVVDQRGDVSYATVTSGVRAPASERKVIELGTVRVTQGSDINPKTGDRETMLQGASLKQLRNGSWVNPNGTAATPAGSGISYELSAGQGDTDTKNARGTAQDYNVRVGLTNSELNLGRRTQ